MLRGNDVADPRRLESNTLHFRIASGERLKFAVRLLGHGSLVIEMTEGKGNTAEATRDQT